MRVGFGKVAMQYAFDFLCDQTGRRKRKDRLFFALMLDRAAARGSDRIGLELKLRHGIAAPLLPVAHRHLSLQHVGDYPVLRGRHRFAACRAASRVISRSFSIVFDRAMTFPARPGRSGEGRYPCVLCCSDATPLLELHRELGRAMQANGLKPGPGFVPHVTLFYGAVAIPPCEVEPLAFAVGEFALIHSEVGLSTYHILGNWPLYG